MRFVRRCLLAVAATAVSTLCISSINNGWNHADAQCVSAAGAATGTPDADALTMFVTNSFVMVGNPNLALDDLGLPLEANGLLAADALCTYYADQSTFAKSTYNRNAGGGTVEFTALLSTVGTNAIDRFVSGKNIKSSNKLGEQCIAENILDLFSGKDGVGYGLDTVLKTESGEATQANQQVWTGTGIFAAGTADVYGGTYHPNGGGTNANNFQCNNWASTAAGGGIIGTLNPTVSANGNINTWLSSESTTCISGYSLYCISAQPFQAPTQPPTPTSGGNGDPQFTGLQGQSFQVHGMPEEFFNLITTPTFQMNSRFTYLASGECHYNNTECWTHPGTYVDQIGFMFPGIQIKSVAGSHRKGLRVWINDEEMKKSSGKIVMTTTSGIQNNSTISGEITVSHPHHDVLIVSSPLFTIEVTNSDWFFNFNLMFHAPEILQAGRVMHYIADAHSSSSATHTSYVRKEVYPQYPMHGLVGQTWKNARYPAKRMYQGEVDDYMLLDHTLFSTQFLFNLYAY